MPSIPSSELSASSTSPALSTSSTRTEELRSFLFLAIVMAPVLAVVTVAGYGFVVWIYQMFAGPPGS